MEKVIFQEEQRNNQSWLVVVLIVSLFAALTPFIYGIYSQEVLQQPFGNNPVSSGVLAAIGSGVLLVVGGANLLVLKMRLKTKVTNEAIWVSFPPLRKWKKITPAMIQHWEIKTYNPNRDFGGHGMKRTRKYGVCYTIHGNIGLQIIFTDGRKFLIGTQKKQALEHAMRKLMANESENGL